VPTLTKAQEAWSVLTSAADEARAVAQAAAERIAEIRGDDTRSDSWKQAAIQRIKDETAAAIAARRQAVADARATLLAAARELSRPPSGDPAAQLLAETRQQRAWARILPQLTAGRPLRDILAEAVDAKDVAAVTALAAEAPAWVQANHQGASGLDRLADGRPNLDGLRQALDVAIVRVLGDDNGLGSAARYRLHVAAHYPLSMAKLAQAAAGGRGDLESVLATTYAQQAADAITAQLDGQAATPSA
jgi:hypothetical protein